MTQREKIEELIKSLKSELNNCHTRYYKGEIPDVITYTDLQNSAVDSAITQIETLITEGKIEELNELNLYYLRHDGEGEHALASQFDKRIATLQASLKGKS